tara:strand:- start:761 stop:1312 length:552 start_codon:yes stop_codon:yes gene_type:complete
MYQEEKSAQMAAFFAKQSGGSIPHLKLIKLLYIADRTSMEESNFPITYDKMKSLPHGPILDLTLNAINSPNKEGSIWNKYIEHNGQYVCKLAYSGSDFDVLSGFDINILETVWKKYGHLNKWELRDLTHKPEYFPEWSDPEYSSKPIKYETILESFGNSKEIAKAKAEEIESINSLDMLLESL